MAKAVHSMIRVLDERRSLAFYKTAFGLTPADRIDFDSFTLIYLRTPETTFELELTGGGAIRLPPPVKARARRSDRAAGAGDGRAQRTARREAAGAARLAVRVAAAAQSARGVDDRAPPGMDEGRTGASRGPRSRWPR